MKFNKKSIIIFIVLILIGLIYLGIDYCLYSPSPINKYIATNFYKTPANDAFTDDNFYQCVIDNYNRINSTSLSYTINLNNSELESITSLSCSGRNIVSAKGIEKMPLLTYIDFQNNNLEELYISNMNSLNSFNLNGNKRLIIANDNYSKNGKTYVKVGVTTEMKLNVNFPSHFSVDDYYDPMERTEFVKIDNNKFNILINVTNSTQVGIKIKNLNTEEIKTIYFNILGYNYDEFDDTLIMINDEQSDILNSVEIYPSDDTYLNNYTINNLCNSSDLSISDGIISSNNASGDCQIKIVGPDSLYEIPLNIHMIKISSDLYEINKINRIYTGNHSKQTEIQSNLIIEGANAVYKFNSANNDVLGLSLYFNEKNVRDYVIKPFKYINYKLYNVFGNDKYIFTSNDNDESILRNISSYGQEEIIDNKLKISYGWYNDYLDFDIFNLVRINSEIYSLDNEYLYVGTDELNLNDISVVNGTSEIKDNKLLIKYEDDILKEFKLVSINSGIYDLSNDYIYVGNSELNLNEISVVNGTSEIKDNKLLIKYEDDILKEFKLVSINSGVYDLSNDYILSGGNVDLEKINVINGLAIEEDNKLKIKYGEEVLDTYEKSAFIDQNFYNCVVDSYNKENDSNIEYNKHLNDEQLQDITYLSCSGYEKSEDKKIKNTSGIEKNINLKHLSLTSNLIESLDVTQNTELESIYVDINKLTEIDLSNNLKLKKLSIGYYTDIKVNNRGDFYSNSNPYIENTNCISNLDLTNNKSLEKLYATDSCLKELNVSGVENLKLVNLMENELADLDMKGVINLETLYVDNNKLTNINLEDNINLKYLYISNNYGLEFLDVSSNIKLIEIFATNNKLESIDLRKNTMLKKINLGGNKLTSLDLSNNLELTQLDLGYYKCLGSGCGGTSGGNPGNKITEINLNNNKKLVELYLQHNQLTSLDLSENLSLKTLDINNNPFKIKVKPILLGNNIIVDDNKIVKLPSHLTSTNTSVKLSDGLGEIDNGLIALNAGVQNYVVTNKVGSNSYDETYEVEVVDIKSSIYDIDKTKDYIYIGGDTYEEALNNIEVINGISSLESDTIIIKNGEDEVKRFKLIGLKSSVYDLSNDYIYVSSDTNEDIINNIETNANISIENNILNISYGNYSKSYTLVRLNIGYDISNGYIYTLNNNPLDSINVINGDKSLIDSNVIISYNNIELDRIPYLTITSDIYDIDYDYIYTGLKDITLDNINKTNVELSTLDNNLILKYEGNIVDEIPYYYLQSNISNIRLNSKDNKIYIKEDISYNDFINGLKFNQESDNLKYNIYNITDELVNEQTVITEGFKVEVLYNELVLDIYMIEISAEYLDYTDNNNVEYTEEYGKDILKNLNINNIFVNVRELIDTDGEVSVKDKEDNILDINNNIKTGDKFVVTFPSSNEYFIYLSVRGDVTGTGSIGEEDVIKSYQVLRGEIEVERPYELAADINSDGKIKINDIAKIYQYVNNKIESLED